MKSVGLQRAWIVLKEMLLKLLLDRNTGMILDDIGAVCADLVPVHDVPPSANVLRSTVLVL